MVEKRTNSRDRSEHSDRTPLLDRRSYLKLTGATAALTGFVAAGSASEHEYDIIELDRGEAVTYDLSAGETFENKLIDQTARGATFAIRARDIDDFTVRNVGFYGIGDRSNGSGANQHMLLSGTGTVENVYMNNIPGPDDEQSSPTPMGGIYIRPSHSGHIDIQHTYIEGMGNNASYADRPGRGGGGGTVRYENCYHLNNTVSQYRIGTSGSEVRNCIGLYDDPTGERATYIGGSSSKRARGVWAWHNTDLSVVDSCFYASPDDIQPDPVFQARMHSDSSGSECVLHVRNCYVNGDAPAGYSSSGSQATVNIENLTETPTATVLEDGGVPTEPEMAAGGYREYVDPFDEGLGGDTAVEPSEPRSTLLVDGEGSSERSTYRFTVDGTVEKSESLSEYGNSAEVTGGDVEGFVRGGVDGFQFDGELDAVDIDGPAVVYLDDEELDPSEYGDDERDDERDDEEPTELALQIDGNGSSEQSNYQFVVDGTVEKSDELSAYGNNASVDDQEVNGFVRGGVDGFRVTGELVAIEIDDGPTVSVDGEPIDPDEVGADESDDADSQFELEILETTSPVTAGEQLDVRVSVTNDGDREGTQEVSLGVTSFTVDSKSVSLSAGETTSIELSGGTFPVRNDVTFDVIVASEDTWVRDEVTLLGLE